MAGCTLHHQARLKSRLSTRSPLTPGGKPCYHGKVVEVHFLTQPPLMLLEGDGYLVTSGYIGFHAPHFIFTDSTLCEKDSSSSQDRGGNPLTLQVQGMAGRRTYYCHEKERHRWKSMPTTYLC